MRRGFTLLEIIAVISVITVLAAILLSVFSKSRASARRAQCDTHLKSIALALDAFRQEIGHYPATLQELQDGKYLTDPAILACPADPRTAKSYEGFYVLRAPRAASELPILVCPFHEESNHGIQAYTGRYTTQFMVSPATLTAGIAVNVEHPGKNPVAAPVGLALHGADILRTSGGGSATIRFADGSEAVMGRDTEMTILQSYVASKASGPLYSLVRQTSGTVRYQVHNGSKFDIVTPTATAGALGTAFEVRVSATQGTWLSVSEGTVRLSTLSGDVTTTSADWTSTPPPQPPPPPPPTGPPPPQPPPPPPRPGGGPPPPP